MGQESSSELSNENLSSIIPRQTMPKVYVLKLVDGKYYVGRSTDVNKRFHEHLNGGGSVWTTKYKPLEIVTVEESTSLFDEDKLVFQYMMLYGVDNVRGGSYSNTELTQDQKKYIENILRSGNDQCYNCGKIGHFAKNCPEKHKDQTCSRCGRNNHKLDACYAVTHINGTNIEKEEPITNPDLVTKYDSVENLTDKQDVNIFNLLKEWRLDKSQRASIKAYQVFTDATLKDIAFYKPKNIETLSCIKGIGEKKIEQYGTEIIKLINQ